MHFLLKCDIRTNGPVDRRMDRRTDPPSYGDARTHLISQKTSEIQGMQYKGLIEKTVVVHPNE